MVEQAHPHLTVTALTKYLYYKFDKDPHLQKVFVVGEISNFKPRPNATNYFSLKDENAVIRAVMFRNQYQKLPMALEDGMRVLVVGRVSLYQAGGSYQIQVERIEPDGIGSLYIALEQLKAKFKEEGLLDLPKQPIPPFPFRIAVITSKTGAVIHDIRTTLVRRNPIVQYELFDTLVQGKEAAKQIVDRFHDVQQQADKFDLVILARGGGSIEDLWCFNEESVARAIIACPLPVISSIGHETDTTLADLVADVRAATPTAAAELAVPRLDEVKERLVKLQSGLSRSIRHLLDLNQERLNNYRRSPELMYPERLLQHRIQQHDNLSNKLQILLKHQTESVNVDYQNLRNRLVLQAPTQQIHYYMESLGQYRVALNRAIHQELDRDAKAVQQMMGLLNAYSPLQTVQRGYSITLTDDGEHIIREVNELHPNDIVRIQLQDGQVRAKIMDQSNDKIWERDSKE